MVSTIRRRPMMLVSFSGGQGLTVTAVIGLLAAANG
jgi:hypothetical protein